MARSSAFDSDDQDSFEESKIRPLFTLEDLNDKDEVLKWVNDTYATELKRVLPYREQAIKHVGLYKGKFYSGSESGNRAGSSAGLGISSAKPSKLVVNHLFDLVNQRVARVLRSPSGVDIRPANSEYTDRIAAKVVKTWIDFVFYKINFDRIRARVSKAAFIMGEAYAWVRWNPEGGDFHPDWKEEERTAAAAKRPPRLQLKDDKGNPVLGEDGEELWIEKPVKVGEVEVKAVTPLNTVTQLTGDHECCTYFFYEEFRDVDELKVLYPASAKDIDAEAGGQEPEGVVGEWRTMQGIVNGPQQRKVLVKSFYQMPTEFLASGRWIVSTRVALLENRPLQPRETGLHLVRLTDIDIPGEQRGSSFYTQGKMLNAAINDLTSMGMRNQKMVSAPKWLLPKGSVVKKDALGNDITMVEYSGPTPPTIYTPPPMNQENMVMKGDLKGDMQAILGSSPTERGEIPANIRSTTALQAAQEQDDMRSSDQNLKQATFTREVVEAMINLASVYYEKDDKRLIPIVGRDNRFLLKEFDPTILTRGFTVRVANDNGMPTSKAVRFDMAIQMREGMPEYMTEERFADWMQWGDDGKILDAATKSQRAAEAENEAMLSGEEVPEPASYEQSIVHWTTHVKELQDYSFKVDVPVEIQDRFIAHVTATEADMMAAAYKNPRFAMELVKISQWPLFIEISPEDRLILDSARTGNPLGLVQMEQLQLMGMPSMTAAPAAGAAGMTSGAPPAPGAQGGFNAATNGVGGMENTDDAKSDTMSVSGGAQDTMAPAKPDPNASAAKPAEAVPPQ
jgi:hypothetical protein